MENGIPKSSPAHMGVDLGRGEVRMTQHRLDRPQICASLEEIRRKGVAQHMGRDPVLGNPRLAGELSQEKKKILPHVFKLGNAIALSNKTIKQR